MYSAHKKFVGIFRGITKFLTRSLSTYNQLDFISKTSQNAFILQSTKSKFFKKQVATYLSTTNPIIKY